LSGSLITTAGAFGFVYARAASTSYPPTGGPFAFTSGYFDDPYIV